MFDRRSASEKFRLAVRNISSNSNQNVDPIQVLASIFRITPIKSATTTTTTTSDMYSNNKANLESFQAVNGTDWSSVLNPWLDVCEASAKVRRDGGRISQLKNCSVLENIEFVRMESKTHPVIESLLSCTIIVQ